jgi:hypothetical protein
MIQSMKPIRISRKSYKMQSYQGIQPTSKPPTLNGESCSVSSETPLLGVSNAANQSKQFQSKISRLTTIPN